MANWFVRSLAAGTGAGTSWTNATTTVAAAITLSAAGDTFWIADDHAETTASNLSLVFKGTQASPDKIICVDHTIASPGTSNLRTTGTISATSTATMGIAGVFYCYGLTFNVGSTTNTGAMSLNNSGSSPEQVFEACNFRQLGSAASTIAMGVGVNARCVWENCTIQFGNIGSSFGNSGGLHVWRNSASAITGATIPTAVYRAAVGGAVTRIEGVDLSAVPSGKTIIDANSKTIGWQVLLKDCKLASGVTVSGVPNGPHIRCDVVRCDSGATNTRNESYQYGGNITTETTIVRTGGATDGTTPWSWKVVTNANAKWQMPVDLPALEIWNDTSGSAKTITLEAISSAVLNNDDIWFDCVYPGSSSTPLGSVATTTKANILATGAANTTSSAAWGGSTSPFKMAVTITPQAKGPIKIYPRVGKASTTVYIDPFVTVT
jgi:hypothetical protein